MQKAYDKYLERREIESKKDKKTTPQKLKILIEYFKTNEEAPSRSKTDKHNETHGFDLGMFWANLVNGQYAQKFEDAKKKSPNMQKAYDKYLERREIESKKDKKTAQQKMNILIKYFETNKKAPSQSKTDKHNETHGFNLGKFWSNLLDGKNKELFEDARKKSPNMKKAYEKYLEKREIESKKDKKTAQQKMKILIECFKNTDFLPSHSKTDKHNVTHGVKLGEFWSNLVAGKNKQLFEDAKKKSPNMQKAYDKYLEMKEKRTHKND